MSSTQASSYGLRGIRKIKDFDISGKPVFLRLDLNVPLNDKGEITDDTRITASLPTIQYGLEQGAKLILASHLGRPKDRDDKSASLEPVARRLTELLKVEVILMEDPNSDAVKAFLSSPMKNQIILLENVRYEPGETENSEEFAQTLAGFAQIYINDAFGACHRAHSTIHALPQLMKDKGIGLLIEKEVTFLDQLLENPKRPYIAVLGGSKVSDKIDVIERLINIVDGFVIGGAMAYTFLKAQGHNVGKSRVEADKIKYAKEMIERIEARQKTLLLPVDHIVTDSITNTNGRLVPQANMGDSDIAVDIGPQTIKNFSTLIGSAQTVFWNGPMGIFETPEFSKGTFAIAKAIAESPGVKVVGGGDSAAAAHASGYAEKMSHISTGGGASLEYLQGEKLPGLEILRDRRLYK